MQVLRVKSKLPANFPFVVQVKNTENWNSVNAYPPKYEHQALARAEGLALAYPNLPVRIMHCTGGAL